MIQVYVLSPVNEIWQRLQSLNLESLITFKKFEEISVSLSEIASSDSYQPILLIDDSSMHADELMTFLHKVRAENSHLAVGYIFSYGKEAEAHRFHKANLIHFFLPRRIHHSLLISEFFTAANRQISFSVSLQELLELALDNNCSPVAEKIAQIKQQFASN